VNIDHFGDREAAVWETSPPLILNHIGLTLPIISVKSILFERKIIILFCIGFEI
jgi:hypothetical protein